MQELETVSKRAGLQRFEKVIEWEQHKRRGRYLKFSGAREGRGCILFSRSSVVSFLFLSSCYYTLHN